MGVNFAFLRGLDCIDIFPSASLPASYDRIDNPLRRNRRIYRFENGYGVSAIPDGRKAFNVAIIRFTGAGIDGYDICRLGATVIFGQYDNVCRGLNHSGLYRFCRHVKALNRAGNYRGVVKPSDFGLSYWSY